MSTHYENNSTYSQINRVDNQNISYIFGVKKNDRWHFVPHRFILSGLNTKLYGQFISSNWFNDKFEDRGEYIIVGVNKSFKYSDVSQKINSFDKDSNNLNITNEESDIGIVFKDKFVITKEIIHEQLCNNDENTNDVCKKNMDNEDKSFTIIPKKLFSLNVTLKGQYNKSYLSLSVNKLSNGSIYTTLPDFTMRYDN
tara:strand:- start:1955 stop:2545 length:591 start_codon:yes stop_codon:yes gene_type:complete